MSAFLTSASVLGWTLRNGPPPLARASRSLRSGATSGKVSAALIRLLLPAASDQVGTPTRRGRNRYLCRLAAHRRHRGGVGPGTSTPPPTTSPPPSTRQRLSSPSPWSRAWRATTRYTR